MRCDPQNIQSIFERFNNFFDSVLCSFRIDFSNSSLPIAEVVIECQDADDNPVKILIKMADVVGWSFVNFPKQSSDFVTEGFRVAISDGMFLVDFGNDPDVDLHDPTWTQASAKWLIGKELMIGEA